MDARSAVRGGVAILVIAVGSCFPVFATSVHIYRGDFDLPIIDKPGRGSSMTEAIIQIPDHFVIYDLDVRINITHTNVFDLQLFLKSPRGARICLNMFDFKNEFSVYPNYTSTIFDDEAPLSIENAAAPFTGRFKPRGPGRLEAFDGRDSFGLWRLQIFDMFDWDYGTLDSFELMFTTPEPATVILLTLGVGLVTMFKPRRGR